MGIQAPHCLEPTPYLRLRVWPPSSGFRVQGFIGLGFKRAYVEPCLPGASVRVERGLYRAYRAYKAYRVCRDYRV